MRTTTIALLLALAAPAAAQRAATAMADSTHTLAGAVVVGVRPHYLTPSQTLTGKALQDLSTTSVADALKYFSGVQIKDYGGLGGLKTVNVRSLGSQHVGVYLDGIRITNAQNGQVDLGRYSLSNMEAVALYNANKSERLQSASEYASAATVYMRTRRPERTEYRLEYGGGSFGLQKAKGYLSLGRTLFLDAEYQHADGDYSFRFRSESEDTTGTRHNSDITFFRTEAAFFLKGFSAHLYYYDSERGLPGPVVRRLSDQWDSTDRQWDRDFFVQASYENLWDRIGLRTNLKYACDHLRYLQDPSTNAATMYVDNHYTQQDIYGSVAASYNLSWLSLTASTDLRWSDLTADVYRFSYVYRLDWKALLSAIVSYRGLEANAALLYTRVTDHTRGAATPLGRLTPTLIVSYRHGPWVVRAFHKRIFRAPTLNDLYYTLVGNARLQPEYTTQWDAGADYRGRHLHFAADAYYNRVTDKIVAIPMKCQFRWSMTNFGLVRSLGLSLTAGYDNAWGDWSLSASANYTCQQDRDYSSPHDPEYKNYIPYSPLHSGSLIVDAGYRGYSLCASLLYTGERFALVSNNADDLLPSWYTLDVKASRTFLLGRHTLQATLECNNLTGSRHEVVKRYPMPGRNVKFTIAWKI